MVYWTPCPTMKFRVWESFEKDWHWMSWWNHGSNNHWSVNNDEVEMLSGELELPFVLPRWTQAFHNRHILLDYASDDFCSLNFHIKFLNMVCIRNEVLQWLWHCEKWVERTWFPTIHAFGASPKYIIIWNTLIFSNKACKTHIHVIQLPCILPNYMY